MPVDVIATEIEAVMVIEVETEMVIEMETVTVAAVVANSALSCTKTVTIVAETSRYKAA
jgi:hypothetical protein